TVRRYRAGVAWWAVLYGPAEAVAVGEGRVSPAEGLAWSAGASPTGGLLMVADDAEALVAAVRQVRDDGPAVAGVGLTAHQHEGVWSVEELRKRISRAAAAGRPVHIAAVTIVGDPETEAEQAEAVRHFYTAAFAHPKVASITWWDLSDRFAWRNAPAGLLRADLSPKPAYRVLDDLLNLRWRTNAAGRTDADGAARARVFFGAYQVAARADGRQATLQVHLGKGGPGTVEVTLPPGK
ncbi:MAG: endo-1,4-beta-xylanase, partial [Planctomycetes bacterium]|nr:endo-1,4-beta-xylanase [Planctomycetota bacterium]